MAATSGSALARRSVSRQGRLAVVAPLAARATGLGAWQTERETAAVGSGEDLDDVAIPDRVLAADPLAIEAG